MKQKISLKKTITACVVCFISAVLITCLVLYLFMGKLAHGFVKLSEMDFLARQYFYGEISDEELENAICRGYVSALGDRYATYLPTTDAKEKFDEFEGKTSGIGVTLVQHPDTHAIYITSVSKDSPADKAGIKAGDSIIAVGGTSVDEENYNECFDSLKGKIGDKIAVTVLRGNEELNLEITVANFELQSVYVHTVGDYGYVRITQFSDNTVEQFESVIDTLVKKNVKGLIFDVTQNGGGTVDSVSAMLDYLLPEGDIISAEYAGGKSEVLFKSDKAEIDLPMVVITDRRTASAAELFAASIRDYEKGVLVGHTTYGKGVMQTTYKLDDGSSVKFTVAKFFSASKTDFDGKGLKPDYEIKLTEHEAKYFYLLSDKENPYIKKAVEWLDNQK